MNAIEIRNLSIKFGNNYILENVSLDIEKNSMTTILGPNGGGKTTLIKAILGLIRKDSGSISISEGSRVGYVPQFNSFNSSFPVTVFETIMMSSLSDGSPFLRKFKDDERKRADSLVKLLGIEKIRNSMVRDLSGGELQKTMIARALMSNPDILILDEPTASIDSKSRSEIYAMLNEMKKHTTIILISHDIGSISSYVDHVACLNRELISHEDGVLSQETLDSIYGCPIDLIAHGVSHRVFKEHLHD